MIDWDDVRYFLATSREGSVRAAAQRLGVNHATVLRRIAGLEARLGAHLFEKLPSGYRLTDAGEEVLELAGRMEAASQQLEGRVLGRDQGVSGPLRVTMPPPLASYLLMPDLAEFTRLYPDIELDILATSDLANLTNREADVALRVVYDRKTLPPHLRGLKGPDVYGGVFISRERLTAWRDGAHDGLRWIVISAHGVPEWATSGDLRTAETPFRVNDGEALLAAIRAGIGLGTLSCFIGDADRLLVRAPGTDLHLYGTLWLLTLGDMRNTKRVRLFVDFIARRLATHTPRLSCGSQEFSGN